MSQLTVDPIRLELGFDLVPLAKQNLGGTLVERIGRLREEILLRLGIKLPPIRICDNFEIEGNQFAIFIKGIKISEITIDSSDQPLFPASQFEIATKLIIRHLRELFLKYPVESMDYEQLNLLGQHGATYPNLIVEFNGKLLQKLSLLRILKNSTN